MKFTIPGNPIAQGRPRFARFGKFVKAYDPKDSSDFKSKVALFAQRCGFSRPEGALTVTIVFYMKRPKYLSRKADSVDRIACFKKPDIDNLIKATFDGCKGILYTDDSQIQSVTASKYYHEIGGQPRTEVTIN